MKAKVLNHTKFTSKLEISYSKKKNTEVRTNLHYHLYILQVLAAVLPMKCHHCKTGQIDTTVKSGNSIVEGNKNNNQINS